MKIKEAIVPLERVAPLFLQEDWDNSGLQVGSTETQVSGVLLCLDVTEAVVEEAICKGCNLIVSHHPLLFKGLKTISDADFVQRTVVKAIENKITIVSMHTNMDNAFGGVNYKMAERLSLESVDFLVKKEHENMLSGSGIIGTLPQEMSADSFIRLVKRRFGVATAMCNATLQRPIKRVALCGGAGEFLLNDAIKAQADAFVTGEMHYHTFFGIEEKIQICIIGHWQSEQFAPEIFYNILQKNFPDLPLYMAQTSINPIMYM